MTERWVKMAFYSGALLLVVLFSALLVPAQSSAAAPANTAKEKQVSSQPDSFGDQLARESREAAGEEKGENDELKKSPSVRLVARLTGMSLQHAYWLCMLLNFFIIAAAVVWLSGLHLPRVFRARTESIQSAMKEAQKASEDADRRLAEIELRLSHLDTEIASMQKAAEQEGAAEEGRIQRAAEEDRRKIVESAQQEISAAAKAARRDLKVYAADLAVALAQRQIRIDNATDQALVRTFADQLGGETNGNGKDNR